MKLNILKIIQDTNEKLIESKIQLHYKNTPKRYLNVRCYLK